MNTKKNKLPAILLVENHEDTLESIRTFLELQGYEVTIARDVKSAAILGKTLKFDLLVSDISLPDGDGWNLLKLLSAKKTVRAIAMSGFGMKADLAKSKTAGFSDHLIKPFQGETLEDAIRTAVPEFFTETSANNLRKRNKSTETEA